MATKKTQMQNKGPSPGSVAKDPEQFQKNYQINLGSFQVRQSWAANWTEFSLRPWAEWIPANINNCFTNWCSLFRI